MVSDAERPDRLADDPRLSPPEHLQPALAEAEEVARVGTRWNTDQTTEVVLRVWARVIDDIGSYRRYGADDYLHHISYRMRLHRLMRVLRELGHDQAIRWLSGEVDRLDQFFIERSEDDTDDLMLRKEKSNPDYWFLRRLPNDHNVVDHLRLLQPKKSASDQ